MVLVTPVRQHGSVGAQPAPATAALLGQFRRTMRRNVKFHLGPMSHAARPVRLGRQCWKRLFVGKCIVSRLPASSIIVTVAGSSPGVRGRNWNSRAAQRERCDRRSRVEVALVVGVPGDVLPSVGIVVDEHEVRPKPGAFCDLIPQLLQRSNPRARLDHRPAESVAWTVVVTMRALAARNGAPLSVDEHARCFGSVELDAALQSPPPKIFFRRPEKVGQILQPRSVGVQQVDRAGVVARRALPRSCRCRIGREHVRPFRMMPL